jgi:hypothetical protein
MLSGDLFQTGRAVTSYTTRPGKAQVNGWIFTALIPHFVSCGWAHLVTYIITNDGFWWVDYLAILVGIEHMINALI